ncbi:MAG: ABC transporter permease [Oscillospiraceae bacterium]|jgi:putative ABC transport system permease protein|nr:ABC transporter permease [Oscillospiraceae bacterium]
MLFRKTAFKNILRSKTRSALTMTGIAVGAFAVALISQISAAGAGQVSEILENMGINTVLVQSRQVNTAAHLDDTDIISLGAITGVDKAMPLMSANARAELLQQNLLCLVWGINSDAREIISLKAVHGRLIDSRDIASGALVCVIDEEIALKTYGRTNIVGKSINLLIGGEYRGFEIIGVASSGLSVLQSALSGIIPDFVYVPFSTMQNLTGRETYDKIAVLLNPGADGIEPSATARIETKLSGGGRGQELVASNLLQQKNQLQGIMRTVTFALSVIAGISLFVAGLTVMTTMLVSVNERTREIGIKKSVGACNFDILREFLSESALLALLGSAAGSLAALAVSLAGSGFLGIALDFSLQRFLSPVLFSLFLGGLFGVYPALKAANMKPIDALRM